MKAENAGNCYLCGGPIYVGDSIHTWTVNDVCVAAHEACLAENMRAASTTGASLDGGARQAFEELLKKVAEKNPTGVSDVWIDAAEFGWEAALDYAFGKAAEEVEGARDYWKVWDQNLLDVLAARLRQMQGKP